MINRSSRPIATLFGIPLHVHWSAMLTAVFVAITAPEVVGVAGAGASMWIVGGLAALFFALSLVAHEYADALVARHHGIGVRRVSLWALGGMAELESEPRKWSHELTVSIVGPLASLAVGAVSLGAAFGFAVADVEVPAKLFFWLAIMNVILGVFNLLPGYPLDGGRVLHSLVWWRTRNRNRATLVTATSGRVIGALLIGFGVWSVAVGAGGFLTAMIGWFIMSAAGQARTQAREALRLSGRTAGSVARPLPPAVRGDLSVDDFLTYWAPVNPANTEVVLLIDAEQRATGLVTMAAVWGVPMAHRANLPLAALAAPADSMAVVSPQTDLGDAWAMSASGFILVSEPDRLVGIITAADLQPTPNNGEASTGHHVEA